MADNVTANSGSGGATFAGASLSFSGDTAVFPIGSGAILSGSEGSWTQSLIVGGAGAVTAGTQRMTLASDDPAVSTLSTINGKITACNTSAVVVSSSALPSGAATAAKQPALGTAGTPSSDVISIQGVASGTVVPVSAASLPLPSGAATSALQSDGNASLSSLDGKVTACNTGAVTIGAALPAGTNAIGKLASNAGVTIGAVEIAAAQTLATVTNLAQMAGTAIAMGTGVRSAGTQRVTIATDDLVPVSISSVPSHAVTNAGTFAVQNDARATGGATPSKTVSAASTNATSVKASAGTLYGVQVSNVNAAVRYLKLYNKASAPTVGTDTPVKTIAIPGNTAGAGNTIAFPYGVEFSTGIAFALTTEATDAGTTAVAANEIVVNLDYK